MEMRKKEKTLAGIFSKYIILFCVSTVLLFGALFLILQVMSAFHLLLPADYAERMLTELEEEIRSAGDEVGEWIPDGCIYGLYSDGGEWKQGTFEEQERQSAWTHYRNNHFYGEGGYYRFIPMADGDVCIVRYYLMMRYADRRLNALLPAPELCLPFLYLSLLVISVLVLSRRFGNRLKGQLQELQVITDKIAEHDLEFDLGFSEIREINEVLLSLGSMRDALQDSLQNQWNLEKQRQEQLSALAHDIKTPLTVIRGNAELLDERMLSEKERFSEEDRECAAYVLDNVKEIEQYLEVMRQVLRGAGPAEEQKALDCGTLEEWFREAAKQVGAAEKIPVSFEMETAAGTVFCFKEQLLRAWKNLVSNGAEHTDDQHGIEIFLQKKQKGEAFYLVASVRDYGPGFSERDLLHAAEEFYSGDTSRHDRKHQGLGLAIAQKFIEAQGGFLEYQNHSSGNGAVVSLWIAMA